MSRLEEIKAVFDNKYHMPNVYVVTTDKPDEIATVIIHAPERGGYDVCEIVKDADSLFEMIWVYIMTEYICGIQSERGLGHIDIDEMLDYLTEDDKNYLIRKYTEFAKDADMERDASWEQMEKNYFIY